MRPLFTIHGGEYLVGSYIETHFKNVRVWIPSRDTGIDLLVSDKRLRRFVSLQVKFSKDFLVMDSMKHLLGKDLRACGFWTVDRDKLRVSPSADFWVFVLLGFGARTTDFVIVRPKELLRRLDAIHGAKKKIQTYIWVTDTEPKRCWETRGLRRSDQLLLADGGYLKASRDLTKCLNNWAPIIQINR
jgi:hypothetical protein